MRIVVNAKPGAGRESVEETAPGEFTVAVREPPVDGRANRAIVSALADHFNVNQSQVRIVVGHTSRKKIVDITGAGMV